GWAGGAREAAAGGRWRWTARGWRRSYRWLQRRRSSVGAAQPAGLPPGRARRTPPLATAPPSPSDPQSGLLQDPRREQHVAAAADTWKLGGDQHGDLCHPLERRLAAGGVHHREQVVRPVGQMARAAVAVGDELERAAAP